MIPLRRRAGKKGPWELSAELHKGFLGPLWLGTAHDGLHVGERLLIRRVGIPGAEAPVIDALEEAARWAVDLEHVNIVGLVSVLRDRTHSDDDELLLVSGHAEGVLLDTLARMLAMARTPPPPRLVMRIVEDIADALIYLHAQQLHEKGQGARALVAGLHPGNVLLGADGVTRLLEPGASAVVAAREPWRREPKRAAYDAPEQHAQDPAFSPKSDQFSLGVIAWELLRNRPLFAGPTFAAVVERVRGAAIRRADALKPAGGDPVPKPFADVVARLLERNPDERYDSATDVAHALADDDVASHGDVAAWLRGIAAEPLSREQSALAKLDTAMVQAKPAAPADLEKPAATPSPPVGPTPAVGPEPAVVSPAADSAPKGRKPKKRTLLGMPKVTQPAFASAAPRPASEPPGEGPSESDAPTAVDDLAAETAHDGTPRTASSLAQPDPDVPTTADDPEEPQAAPGPAIGGPSFDVFSIADDPSEDDSLSRSAQQILQKRQESAPLPSKPSMLLGLVAVAAVVLVGGAYAVMRGGTVEDDPQPVAVPSAISSVSKPSGSDKIEGAHGDVDSPATPSGEASSAKSQEPQETAPEPSTRPAASASGTSTPAQAAPAPAPKRKTPPPHKPRPSSKYTPGGI